MSDYPPKNRRQFLHLIAQATGSVLSLSALPTVIQRALAIPAAARRGTIRDVRYIVILMQENRSFDHYFGTLRGVRGFADRHPVPLASGKPVWFQSDGNTEIAPFHLDTCNTSAIRTPPTPHSFSDAQAAWNQGSFGYWPKFKTGSSMGYYRRADIPFQFALAEAFTICDAHHCSVTTGTDPNRIMFWSGSNANPELRGRGINCTDEDSEPDNLRCWIEGALPAPGYRYSGSAFRWPTIPEILGREGITWRIYQDPNDNWTGAMHGGLAFESFRAAKPQSPLYRNGMTHWSLEQFAEDVKSATLPQVCWILPPMIWSEHPHPSSPIQGAEFTSRILDALIANPDVWSRTVFFQTFDENDGLFDHVPPPAPPSYNTDGTLAGKSTLDLRGSYFSDPERKHLHPSDTSSGTIRPWGLGPRVPLYVISPWSKGGWVNSQVFDHTSIPQFLEKRFGFQIPNISPWHRSICGDLTSAFDFVHPNDPAFPNLPIVRNSAAILADYSKRPNPFPPSVAEPLFQELGVRPSRALPYSLEVKITIRAEALLVKFINSGAQGAVFHVYDRLRLERIPRRYTVEAGKSLNDQWSILPDTPALDLWIYGPNGFVRELTGSVGPNSKVDLQSNYDIVNRRLQVLARNSGNLPLNFFVQGNGAPNSATVLAPGEQAVHTQNVSNSLGWYDVVVSTGRLRFRLAGRMELGAHSISDPGSGACAN